jgi:dsDNA-binding SOS-regulon protein
MTKGKLYFQSGVALPALAAFLLLGAPAGAQSVSAQAHATVQDDATRQELARFDQFLDDHRELGDQLRKDPSLVNNEEFVKSHPELLTYLQQHPRLREELRQNPDAFKREEGRYERRDDDRGRDANRAELAHFDQFLDSHREIAEQLRKDPSLVDNEQFVRNHPALETYLRDHPELREQLRSDPNAFMREEARYDQHEDNRDTHRDELARFDEFLDHHHEIAEQLRKDPSLVDNEQFVKNHPALQTYLRDHPELREELRRNPDAFREQEARYEHREDGMDRDRDRDRDTSRRFGEFLGSHSNISQELSKDPSLVKNREYMENHPELRDYLNAHPDVRQDLMAHPDTFVSSAQGFSNGTNGNKGMKTPMPDAKPKQ